MCYRIDHIYKYKYICIYISHDTHIGKHTKKIARHLKNLNDLRAGVPFIEGKARGNVNGDAIFPGPWSYDRRASP
jgi:hypothetical protein